MDDCALIDRILEGDPAAGEELVTRYEALVWWTVGRYRVLGHDAEDLFQEAFEKLWAREWHVLRQWNRRSHLAAYLCQCVRNACLDRLRAEGRQGGAPQSLHTVDPEDGDWMEWEIQDPAPGPEQILMLQERMAVLRQALNDLPCLDRQVLELTYFEGKKQREIAEITGRDVKQIGSLLSRAQKKLRGLLRERCPGLFEPDEAVP